MKEYVMKGRFKRKVRKVRAEDEGPNKTIVLINDPLMMDVEERRTFKMPMIDKRHPGVFKLICEPWGDPLLAKTADKT